MAEKVTLVTSEGEEVEVDKEIAIKSVLIKSMIDDSSADESIPLPNVKKAILDKVIEFCNYIRDNPSPEIEKPLKTANMSEIVAPWFVKFVDLEKEVLFEIILAANFLDIKPLLELSCAKVASLIKGKSIPEIRSYFDIENDFTPEEEQQIMEENKWAEEAF